MTSQQCDTNVLHIEVIKKRYCTVVSHACINAPLVRSQAKPKIVRSYRQHGNVTSRGEMRARTGPVSTVPGYVVYHQTRDLSGQSTPHMIRALSDP